MNGRHRVRAVVFDLDGTLVDSAPDIAHALNIALTGHGLPAITVAQTRSALGGGARVLVGEALRTVGGSPSVLDAVLSTYTDAYAAETTARTVPYADAVAVLAELHRRGRRVGVCTNKRTALAHEVLAGTGLADFVDAVAGIDEVRAGKPDPGHLLAVLDRLNAAPGDTVYVGDTGIDAQAARRAGVAYRHVSWGHPLAGDLADAVVIDDFAALLDTEETDDSDVHRRFDNAT
jgi:phosphoglycolate phosphatase